MKPPIELILPHSQSSIIAKTNQKPSDDFLFNFTWEKCIFYKLKAGKLIRHSYNDYHFYIDIFELEISEGISIECEVTIPGFFAIFLLQGNIDIHLNSNTDGIRLDKENCFACTANAVRFSCRFSKGKHRFFYINPRWSWMKRQTDLYPGFISAMNLPDNKKCLHLPFCLIGPAMKKELKSFMLPDSKNHLDQELSVMKFSKSLLSLYHEEVAKKIVSVVYQLKEYIEQNYSNAQLMKASSLAKLFLGTIRTLDRNFKTEFKITPNQYIVFLRMQEAKKLLNLGWTVKNTAYEVGYENPFNFSRAYKKHFGYSPSAEKRK